MKTVLEKSSQEELITRINQLSDQHQAQWGKMSVSQMMAHMNIWNEWVFCKNDISHAQSFLGKLVGGWMLKRHTKDDTPMAKGMPAGKEMIIGEVNESIDQLKEKWIAWVREYAHYTDPYFHHDFYGKMAREQLGIFAYKHMDHHLRQFNV